MLFPRPVARFGNSALREMKEKGDFRKINWENIATDIAGPTAISEYVHKNTGIPQNITDNLSDYLYEQNREQILKSRDAIKHEIRKRL